MKCEGKLFFPVTIEVNYAELAVYQKVWHNNIGMYNKIK